VAAVHGARAACGPEVVPDAAAGAQRPNFGLPDAVDPLEGWIVSA
jgi:hypothetical protein